MKNTTTMKRDSNIELLRLLMGMAVIILHFNYLPSGGGAIPKANGVNNYILHFLETICVIAVDVFIMITGYFNSSKEKINPSKAIMLLLQLIVFNLGFCIVSGIVNGDLSIRKIIGAAIPTNYYVILYVCLLIISPYLNIVIQKLDVKAFYKFVILLFVLFSIYPTLVDILKEITGNSYEGLSTISLKGSGSGYTIVNFILCYYIGAAVKITGDEDKSIKYIIAIVLGVTLIGIWGLFLKDTVYAYSNPVVILVSACTLKLFSTFKIKSKLINILAPAAFTCYLIHEKILRYYDFDRIITMPPGRMILELIGVIFGIYLISFIAYEIWKILTMPLRKFLWMKFEKEN